MPKLDTEDADDEVDQRYVVPGLARGLAILRQFSKDRPRLTAAELAAGVGVSRSTAYRLIYTLEAEGLIARTGDGRHYELTGEVLRLGYHFLSTRSLGEAAQPYLQELSRRTMLSVYLAVLDGREVLYVAHSAANASLVSSLQVGARQEAWSTASGRVLMAHLDGAGLERLLPGTGAAIDAETVRRRVEEDRAQGLVHRRSDHDPHMASCAAPVYGVGGTVIAALTAIGPASRVLDPAMEEELRGDVRRAARTISAALGAQAA